ncbi:hypothetical protein [Vallitalea guaymasensis]|uniref:hypothetical protein n=1 Tax=Vallitalea guaymasensis TaxID=1185412 RepID=UPI000DE536B9|nr:hypothetical protein [Vallitalea guaymasensis]
MKKIFYILIVGIMIISLCSCNNKKEDSSNNSTEQNISTANGIDTTSDSKETDTRNNSNLDINKQEEVTEPSRFVYTDIFIDGLPTELVDNFISLTSFDNKFGEPIKSEYSTLYDDYFLLTREYLNFSLDLFLGKDKNRTEGTLATIVSQSKTESIVKDIVIGDSLDKVINTFLNEENEIYNDIDYGQIQVLYGDHIKDQSYAFILYENNNPKEIRYIDEQMKLVFYIEENLISKIEFTIPC